jgi:hypothetical protein
VRTALIAVASLAVASMLTPSFAQARGMLGRRATGEALADVGRSYNLSHSTISRLCRSGMFALVRVLVCVFVTAQFLMPRTAHAQSRPPSYARILTDDDVREVLHCPWCIYPVDGGSTYFIRTVEGLNIMFDDPRMAGGVVGLLNVMARAQDACDRTEYEHAFHEYAKMTRPRDQQAASTEMETDSVFGLLHPRGDLSALTDIVVPPFHPCGRTVSSLQR